MMNVFVRVLGYNTSFEGDFLVLLDGAVAVTEWVGRA